MAKEANNFQTGLETVLVLAKSDNTASPLEQHQIQVAGVAISTFWFAHHPTERPEHPQEERCLYSAHSH